MSGEEYALPAAIPGDGVDCGPKEPLGIMLQTKLRVPGRRLGPFREIYSQPLVKAAPHDADRRGQIPDVGALDRRRYNQKIGA